MVHLQSNSNIHSQGGGGPIVSQWSHSLSFHILDIVVTMMIRGLIHLCCSSKSNPVLYIHFPRRAFVDVQSDRGEGFEYDANSWLIPENTLQKGTGKSYKQTNRAAILQCIFLHPFLDLKNVNALHASQIQKCSGCFIVSCYIPNIDIEMCTTVLTVFIWFGSNPKIYVSLCISLYLFISSWYTPK